MDIFSLAVRITEQGADQVISKLGLVSKKGEDTAMSFTKMSGAMKGFYAAIVAGAAAAALGAVIKSAGEAAATTVELQGAVENAGASFEEWSPIMEEALTHLQRVTRFGDEDGRRALATLTTSTGSASKAFDLLGITADVAAKRHMELGEAASLVGKIANGNNAGFRSLGMSVSKSADGMAILREKFSGFAEREGKTVLGQLGIIKNQFGEVVEAIGRAILGTDSLNGVGDELITWLQSAVTWIDRNKGEIQDFTRTLVDIAKVVGSVLVKSLGILWAAFKGGEVVIIRVFASLTEFPDLFKYALGQTIRQFADFIKNITLASDRMFGTNLTEKWVDTLDNLGVKMSATAIKSLGATERATKETIDNLFAASTAADEAVKKASRPTKGGRGNMADPAALAEAEKKAKEAHDKLLAAELELLSHEETRADVLSTLMLRESGLTDMIRRGIPDIYARADAEAELSKIREGLSKAGIDVSSVFSRQDAAFQKAMPPIDAFKQLGIPTVDELNKQIQVEADSLTLMPLVDELDLQAQSLAASALESVDNAFAGIGEGIASTISGAIGGAFTGGLKGAGKAILAGLGSIMGQMGDAMISAGLVMTGLLPALMNPFTSGPALLAAGAALVGLGALLGAIATGRGHGGARGGRSGTSFGSGITPTDITRITMGPTTASDSANVNVQRPMNVTVIGEDDPRAQRAIMGLMEKAGRRNIRG